MIITDTGVGIPSGEIDSIFDRFKKSSANNDEAYGLGLYIVKSIATHYNLSIKVASTPGSGTVFSIIFPADLVRKI
jgi:signal transduction histidine kinase